MNLSAVKRIIAALLLLLWTGSVSRCLAEQYGLLHEMPGLECCEHEHDHEDDHNEEEPGHSHSNPCGICHMIEHSGVSLVKSIVVAEAALVPMTHITVSQPVQTVVLETHVAKVCLRPPIRLPWGAYLMVTCQPARGPDFVC